MDLDIDNYNLDDILNLFKIPIDFDEAHLKKAKQIVLKTHPDKSGLASEYFLFYSKAYKTLYAIYTFKNKNNNKTTDYLTEDVSESHNRILNNYFEQNTKIKDPKQFNDWFNKQFNKLQDTPQSDGYGDWLKTDADIYKTEDGTMSEQINKHKKHVKTVAIYDGIHDMQTTFSGTLLGDGEGDSYTSTMFSGLSFQDIKQAHTESVIPITEDDYLAVKKFNNVEEYARYRNEQNTTPLGDSDASDILNKRIKNDEEMSTNRAYYYAKQQEDIGKKNKLFWGRLQSLTL